MTNEEITKDIQSVKAIMKKCRETPMYRMSDEEYTVGIGWINQKLNEQKKRNETRN